MKNLFIIENLIIVFSLSFIAFGYIYLNKKQKNFNVRAKLLKQQIKDGVNIEIVNNNLTELISYVYDTKSSKYIKKIQHKIDIKYHTK